MHTFAEIHFRDVVPEVSLETEMEKGGQKEQHKGGKRTESVELLR